MYLLLVVSLLLCHICASIYFMLYRLREQAEAHMAHVQSTYELRAILQAEMDNQAREQRQMHIEDVSNTVLVPCTVQCVFSMKNCGCVCLMLSLSIINQLD